MKSDQELYRKLRTLPADQLWNVEVPRFDRATPHERMERVALIRALGVVFAGSGSAQQKADVRAWLVRLLQDPAEKIRRYATAALPKLGAGPSAERELLSLLKTSTVEREKKSLERALDKIGGAATLEAAAGLPALSPQTEQKVKARVLRDTAPSAVRLDRAIEPGHRLRIHLRCRKGLEGFVRDELQDYIARHGRFRLLETRPRCVAVTPLAPFTLADLYQLRCFATINLVLGLARGADEERQVAEVAAAIASPLARQLLTTLTAGSLRYRLDFVGKGHQRGAVRDIATRAYALAPDILNDPRSAPWSVDLHDTPHGTSVELRPRVSPDPRMYYRTDDVAAASHPPLAACMARLAGPMEGDVVWDPFCGSGLELVERALRGGVAHLYGSDSSPDAIAIARANVDAAKLAAPATFACCDFRDGAKIPGLKHESVTLLITNPPMGRRIRLPDPPAFFADFFATAAAMLKTGGRLVFPNPLRLEPRDRRLVLESRQPVDLGGFECRLEVWRKSAQPRPPVAPPRAPPAPARARPPSRPGADAPAPWYSKVAKRKKRSA